jgi:hypothetical protein
MRDDLPETGEDTSAIEWYLARDDQQIGPLTDIEMKKFIELGHMRPTDLVWRKGFADWQQASAVFELARR